MIILFLKFLKHSGWNIPQLFFYTSTKMLFAALTSMMIILCLGSPFIRSMKKRFVFSGRLGDVPKLMEKHQEKSQVPQMGGVLIVSSALVSLVLWMELSNVYTVLMGGALFLFCLLGVIDDRQKANQKKGLSASVKFCIQALIAFAICCIIELPQLRQMLGLTGIDAVTQTYYQQYYLPFYKLPFIEVNSYSVLFYAFTLFIIVGSTNAVNLTDGLDGLAVGLSLLVFFVFGMFSFLSCHKEIAEYLNIPYLPSSGQIAIFLSALCGTCLSFLWFNGHPAQIFMGDSGSLALGGIMGTISVLLRKELLLAICGGVFVIETLSVMIQVVSYKTRRRRIFNCAPLHHHYEMKGWSEPQIVQRFWIIGFILAIISLLSIKVQ